MKVAFAIGDRIELTHLKSAVGHKVSDKKYASQLLDFNGTNMAKISMPIYEGKVVPLEVGDDYRVCFFTNSGLYQCKGRIYKRYLDKRVHVIDVLILSDVTKNQRRKYYRLDCMLAFKYRIVSDVEQVLLERMERGGFSSQEEEQECQEAYERLPKEWEDGTILDLSGGGIRFHTNREIQKGSLVEVALPFSARRSSTLTFKLEVIACVHYETSRVAYEIRGEFKNVKDKEREIVIKYVFEEQRRRMRKE